LFQAYLAYRLVGEEEISFAGSYERGEARERVEREEVG
jgi:hypothetical protein